MKAFICLSLSRETILWNLFSFGLQTILLPAIDNKPLDMTTMESISSLFEEHSPKSMALHLLHSDLDVLGIAITNDKTLFNYQDN